MCEGETSSMVRFARMSRSSSISWRVARTVGAVSFACALAACGGGGSSASGSPAAPSSPSTSVNLTGTWSGTASDSSGPGRMTWQLTQSGSAISGTFTMADDAQSVSGSGTVSGTVSGAAIQFSLSVPAGGFDGKYAACSSTVSGSGSATGSSISGSYSGSSCGGAISSGQLALSKQ